MTAPDPRDALIGLAETHCLAESALGYICGEPVGHQGPHIARIHTWDNDD